MSVTFATQTHEQIALGFHRPSNAGAQTARNGHYSTFNRKYGFQATGVDDVNPE